MPFSACVELTSREHPELPCLERRRCHSTLGAALRLRQWQTKKPDSSCRFILASLEGFILKKQSLLKDAGSGMNEKATNPFGLWLKGEAARRREASPCDLLCKVAARSPQVHTHLPLPALHDSLMLQRQTRITPRKDSWLQGCGASQQPQVLTLWEPRVHCYQRGPSVTHPSRATSSPRHKPCAPRLCS